MALYSIIPGGDFGIAIIIFTIFIRFLMWPLVVKQLHQVKAMRKMQPELAGIKKQAKGNKQLEGMMMLELYKKHNVNPLRSIFILLIQLPIFIGLYSVIQIFTNHRDNLAKYCYDFIEQLGPVKQLIQNPDTFNQHLFGFIDLTRHAIDNHGISWFLLLLAVGSGILQYISTKQTLPQQPSKKGLRQIMAEAAEGKEADQSEMNAVVMQKMNTFMPILMTMIMIGLPGAITLYYAVSTFVAVIQQHILLKQDEEEMGEIADKAVKSAKNREKKAQEAKIVSKTSSKKTNKTTKKSSKSSDSGVIRITAKPAKKKGGRK